MNPIESSPSSSAEIIPERSTTSERLVSRRLFSMGVGVTVALHSIVGRADEPLVAPLPDVPAALNTDKEKEVVQQERDYEDESSEPIEWTKEQFETMQVELKRIPRIDFEELQKGFIHPSCAIKVPALGPGDQWGTIEFNGRKWQLQPESWTAKRAKGLYFDTLAWDGERGQLTIMVRVKAPLGISFTRGRVLDADRTTKLLCQLWHGNANIPLRDANDKYTGVIFVPIEPEKGAVTSSDMNPMQTKE